MKTSGEYTLYYYSEDPAKNLEVLKSMPLVVDAEWPVIDLISPANAEEFPTNQEVVSAEGVVSVDAKYVCARNKKSDDMNCVHSCAISSSSSCFSDKDGKFTIDIPVNKAEFSEIEFIAEDFAGNIYKNTLFGILFDIEPPSMPTISISKYDK